MLICLVASCSRERARESAAAPPQTIAPSPDDDASVPPRPAAVVVAPEPDPARDEDDGDDAPEPLDLDFHAEPFGFDLDGDGRAESIAWTCTEASVALQAGNAKFEAPLGFADLIGCAVAVIDVDPGRLGVVLWVSADEHEEAGPDRNFILRYHDEKLEQLWVEDLDLDFYPDGSWRTETLECDGTARVHRRTQTQWRLVDGTVTREDAVQTEPLGPDASCDDDPTEP
ncbi:MAG: hypothetical protein K0V04_00500 [Deltaproteobacteria bacterium]|nr:hypothetical protein [Deltaproteobacteria bacterium]